jgi:hypothetical protein
MIVSNDTIMFNVNPKDSSRPLRNYKSQSVIDNLEA